ncbi:MAG: hypothetical protein E7B17_03460 [Staphylococcus lugdunensis]|nr:hypothetical protein [Staphylococcus lugdunensis]
MNETDQHVFDYSLIDNETTFKLEKFERQLNRIYNSYSVDVGEVLYHARKELSNYGDGTFIKWAESIGFKESSLYNYINAYKFLQKLEKPEEKETFLAQPKTVQYAMSKPSAKEEVNREVFNGNVKTSQEYKEMERKAKEYEQKLKQRDEQNAQLQSQVEQAQRSESIARKQLEDEQNREPEVIEKYTEPEDYQSIKNMNEHLESEREYYKKLADDFRNEVKDMMDQPNSITTFTKENDNEDYTPILLKILEPSEVFIENYKNNLNEQEIVNKLEKIINKLKEQ